MTLPPPLRELAQRCAAPAAVFAWLEQIHEPGTGGAAGELRERVRDEGYARIAVTVVAASRSLGRLLANDPAAPQVLADLDGARSWDAAGGEDRGTDLARWHRLELLRVAARDLVGLDGLDEVGRRLAGLGDGLLAGAVEIAGAGDRLAVIAMGKLGGEELNYSSDVDVLFVGTGAHEDEAACRAVLTVARQAVRVDAALRPEGRDGPLARSLESYRAYWERWARPWERQALLKARWAAGQASIGADFEESAAASVWGGRLDADAIAELRAMKARVEAEVTRRGLDGREIKRGPGGIRDVEFAVQLLQLVHGTADPALRLRGTLPALGELAGAGYVGRDDAAALALAYRFLRTVEHRLQLVEGAQEHTVPAGDVQRDHLARVLGLSPRTAGGAPADRLAEVLSEHQATVRAIHERLYFRPLLESFTAGAEALQAPAAEERLAAFGFRDATRTRQAFQELTRGLTRSSRLMYQLMPLLLDWCSSSPDPDLALVGLRSLAAATSTRDALVAAFRESPEAARRLCLVAGTSREIVELIRTHPELIAELGDDHALAGGSGDLGTLARRRAESDRTGMPGALRQLVLGELARIAVRDVLELDEEHGPEQALSELGGAVLAGAVEAVAPQVPLAVVAMGRLGGGEQAYGSDLDVLFVYDGSGADDAARAEEAAGAVMRLLNGATPAERVLATDVALRPEGRHGALARSLDAFRAYHDGRAQTWERQALLRARPVAGDEAVGTRFAALAAEVLWERQFGEAEVREIRKMKARIERERLPPNVDPQFHLKLGRGSLSDVEWTVQLLQLCNAVPATGTMEALDQLAVAGHVGQRDAAALRDSYRYCERARNRWHLVSGHLATREAAGRSGGADALPSRPEPLSRLARSLATTPAGLREEYRRVTRRAREVVERLFYGL